ncbi:MAG: hypothetical protein WBA39_04145 [Rivularia sp. (in: cyanobacteria)]
MEKTLYRQFFYPNVQRCTKMGKFLEAVNLSNQKPYRKYSQYGFCNFTDA